MRFANREESLPYYLLCEEPLADLEQRLYRVIESAVEEALDAAHVSAAQRRTLGLFIGTSSSEISVAEAVFKRELKQSRDAAPLMNSSSLGNIALWIMERFGLRGPDFTINTACTASANAVMHADALLRSGRIERALIVGFEHFNSITALGFQGLQLLTDDLMRPFDSRRNGLVLGEACAALVLEKNSRTREQFWLRGAANFCDTHSISAANPDGSTVRYTLERALHSAELAPDAISALKAHGTASLLNDEAEAAGMRQVFQRMPALCALKPRIGHTLGACGLAELALFCGAAQQGWLPATPKICATPGDLGVVLNQTPVALPPGNFMLNYFGFGGNNTSLIVSNLER